jgi:uncharacterized protein YjbI with pentapeptide repeats
MVLTLILIPWLFPSHLDPMLYHLMNFQACFSLMSNVFKNMLSPQLVLGLHRKARTRARARVILTQANLTRANMTQAILAR